MPSKSKEQHNFMAAVANNPAFAKKVGVPQSVGKEFSNADKGRKFSKGGDMKHADVKMDKAMINKAVGKHAAMPASKAHKGLKAGGSVGTTKMGAVRTAAPSKDGIASKGKTKGTMIKMARGGKTC
jgi:hypothetical protein